MSAKVSLHFYTPIAVTHEPLAVAKPMLLYDMLMEKEVEAKTKGLQLGRQPLSTHVTPFWESRCHRPLIARFYIIIIIRRLPVPALMSLLRASLGRRALPSSSIRAFTTSAMLREAAAPVKLDYTEPRNLVKEQLDRQTNPVVADVVNDAPCECLHRQ